MSTTIQEQPAWAHHAAAIGAPLIHLPSGTVGQAKALHEPGTSISSVNQLPVQAWVLELDTGDRFVAKNAEAFRVLSEAEYTFVMATGKVLRLALEQLVALAAATKIPADRAADLLASLFARQTAALVSPDQVPPA